MVWFTCHVLGSKPRHFRQVVLGRRPFQHLRQIWKIRWKSISDSRLSGLKDHLCLGAEPWRPTRPRTRGAQAVKTDNPSLDFQKCSFICFGLTKDLSRICSWDYTQDCSRVPTLDADHRHRTGYGVRSALGSRLGCSLDIDIFRNRLFFLDLQRICLSTLDLSGQAVQIV